MTAPAPAARYRDLLAVRQMRAVLLAHVISMVGSVVAEVALSVLVYARTGSSLLSAATLALGFLPYVRAEPCCPVWPTATPYAGCS